MSGSLFIAQVFGLVYLVLGLGFLVNRRAFERIIDDFGTNAAVVFYGGFLALVVGTAIILAHNVWEASWRVIITVIGWAGFAKGTWMVIFPDSAMRLMRAYRKNRLLVSIHAVGALVFGIVLIYFGFFAG